ncbi:hypothetical protein [Geodermatophilus sp. URMC 64]
MSVELHEPLDRGHPNVTGDLPTVLEAAPMFRRAVAGYDRFQVDTYVRWAEDELATAEREHERLVARHVATRAALDEARELLAHSPGGSEFLQVSRRIGSMLAAAADEAESLRAEAEADRSAAAAQAERVLADAGAEAGRVVAEAVARFEELTAEAHRIVDEAEQAARAARAAARARLERVRAIERQAADHVEEIERRAVAEAAVARLQARDDVLRLLSTGREQRRRADDEAAATRERLDREAMVRRAAVLAEVEALEHRRSALRAEIELLGPVDAPTGGRLALHLRRLLDRLRWRPGFLRAP